MSGAAPGRTSELSKSSVLLRFAFVALLAVLDQWSKSAVFASFDLTRDGHALPRPLYFDWLSFVKTCNGGAAFGQFSQFPYILVIGRAVAVLFLGWLLLRASARPRLVLVAMALVLAGAIGNLIDNLWTGCRPGSPDTRSWACATSSTSLS